MVKIEIIDNGYERYVFSRDSQCLGRQWDNESEEIQVIRPLSEKDSLCTMIVTHDNEVVDHITVDDSPIKIRSNLSQYEDVCIGFSFTKVNGYIKNSEYKTFYFLRAQKPDGFVPVEPIQSKNIDIMLSKGFIEVKWKENAHNTLQFVNAENKIAQEIELSGFVQEQSDFAELDTAKETYVKNKSTKYLLNEGDDGSSPYATEKYVLENSKAMQNIADVANNSLNANSIESNTIINDGFIQGNNIITDINPVIISSEEELISNGYYAIPSSYFEIDGRGHYLYEIIGLESPTNITDLLPNIDNYGRLITKHYKADSKNMNVFGEDNTNLGSNSIVSGNGNISSASNSLITGYQNISDSSDSLIAGSNNISKKGCNTVVGARNIVSEKQGFATGYNNKILEGAYFADTAGVGNINQGTATSSRGGYNLAGSEYSSVEGIDNIAGGDATFNGKHLADIDFYSDAIQYGVGALVKRNGFVFKAIKSSKSIIPNPTTNLDYWEIVQPLITTRYAKACKASGEKCVAKNTGSFTHGYRLTSGRDYQTVLGKNNKENTSALLVVGAGSAETSKLNALEVNQLETNINGRINIKNTGATGVLRETSGGELVISGEGSVRLRPTSTSSNRGGIVIKEGYIAPEMTSDLGTSGNEFNNLYLDGNIYTDGTVYLNNQSVKSIFADKIGADINPTTYVMTISLKSPNGQTLSNATVDLPLETMVIGATYSDGKLHLTLKSGETLDVDITDIVSGLVPDTRTINGKNLKTDITLTAEDLNIDLTNYVTFNDTAEANGDYGVVKLGGTANGIGIAKNDCLYVVGVRDDEIESETTSSYRALQAGHISKIVKKGLSNSIVEWTEDEKKSATDLIGAVKQVEYSQDQTFADGSDYGSIGRLYMRYRDNTENSILAHCQNRKYTVPVRDAAGNFYVGNPTQVYHCATKGYVDDVRLVAEGKTKSFVITTLADLGTLLGFDGSTVADDYTITNITITYKEQSVELKQGDLFLIVDTNVPDYWVSVDDMKIYKMETTKVNLTDYVKTTDYGTSKKAGIFALESGSGIWANETTHALHIARASESEIDARKSNYKPIVPSNLDYAVNSVLKERVTLTLKDNGAYTLTINKE